MLWLTSRGGVRAESPQAAAGQAAAASPASFEQRRLERALRTLALTSEAAPQGKRIAFVRFAREDIFVRDERWPLWLNRVHGLSREDMVRRELLFAEGGRYDEARIEETMRNLRGMGIFALVRVAAVKADRPDAVGVLVYTRDLWSLRIEDSFSVTRGVVNDLLLRLVERNLLGRNQALGAEYRLVPQSYQLAQDYHARRVALSSVALSERAGLVFRESDNRLEGEIASLGVGQPYYRLAQRFSWEAAVLHDRRVARNTSDGRVRLFPESPEPGEVYAKQVYRRRLERAYLTGWWRAGDEWKHTLGFGWEVRALQVQPLAETELASTQREAFVHEVMPTPRRDSGPALSYELFQARWVTFTNLATFGQSENVRVGPSLGLSARAPLRTFGSTHHALVLSGGLGLTFAPAGFLLELTAKGSVRREQGRWIDQYGMLQLRGATPVFWIFRFAARALWEVRRHDSQRTNVTLGGDNGLRGYRSQAFAVLGGDRLLANFELRSLPWVLRTVHLGAVLFYDVGSVFPQPSALRLQHAVGIGIRLLLPQFNRLPSSFDGGIAFDPSARFALTSSAGPSGALTEVEDFDLGRAEEQRMSPAGPSRQ